eukprot:2045104-Amphidinium_carterae.1
MIILATVCAIRICVTQSFEVVGVAGLVVWSSSAELARPSSFWGAEHIAVYTLRTLIGYCQNRGPGDP